MVIIDLSTDLSEISSRDSELVKEISETSPSSKLNWTGKYQGKNYFPKWLLHKMLECYLKIHSELILKVQFVHLFKMDKWKNCQIMADKDFMWN